MSSANGTAVNLRELETDALRRELRDRDRCVDCHTQNAIGWVPAGLNRVRCAECHKKPRAEAQP